ncbi:hypothetical protein BDV06DRAFT_205476 [Aspergillus oleicola]
MLHYVGVDLGWTLYMLGVVTCPGIFPMIFTVLWRRQSKAAAILSPILGLVTGIAVWLTTARHFGGGVSVATTGEVLPCVYGTVASCFSPILYSVFITIVKPQDYDWAEFKRERLALEEVESDLVVHGHEECHGNGETTLSLDDEEGASSSTNAKELKRWGRIAAFWSAATFLGHWVLWPLPMYGSHYVFEKKFYIAWVIVAIVWLWATLFVATLYPILDGGYQQILQVWRGLRGAKSSRVRNELGSSEDASISYGDGVQGKEH